MTNPTQASIFLPVLVVVLLTFLAFVRMAMARAAAAKGGQDPNYYRAMLGAPEPEAAVAAVRHYNNLFELPLLFYAGCIIAYVLNAVNGWTLAFAWIFVAARIVQSAVHLTYNTPAHRGVAFVVGMVAMLCLWGQLAMVVLGRV